MLQINVEQGPHAGLRSRLNEKQIIGRDPMSDVALGSDQSVSRRHALLEYIGGKIFITDLASTAGTIVNGRSLAPNQRTPIAQGDTVRIGQSTIVIKPEKPPVHVQQRSDATPPPVWDRNLCQGCGRRFSLFGAHTRSGTRPGMCSTCAAQEEERYLRFARVLRTELNTFSGSPQELVRVVENHARNLGLNKAQALSSANHVSAEYLQRVLTFYLSDGELSEEEERVLREYLSVLAVFDCHGHDIARQLDHYGRLRTIRRGPLPRIRPSVMMPADEIAHLEVKATHFKQLTNGYRPHYGTLILTNKRLVFTETDMPFEIGLSKILNIRSVGWQRMELQLSKKQGTGVYECQGAVYFVETMRVLLEQHHRHRVIQQAGSRSIPQHVKVEVYQRDGGRCVQCGATEYLEFDHVIPFSKGGASSVENLQILCRQCNLDKRDRI